MRRTKTKNASPHLYQCAIDAVRVLRLKESQGLEFDTDYLKSTLDVCTRFIESIEAFPQQDGVLNGYDLTSFASLLNGSTTPAALVAFCVQSKSDLADIRGVFEALDTKGIYENLYKYFCLINSTLAIAQQMFLSIRPAHQKEKKGNENI